MNESQGDSFRVNRVCRVAFGYVTISQIKVAKSWQNTRQALTWNYDSNCK